MPQALAGSVVELALKITARASGIPAMVQALAIVMGQARLQRGYIDCQLYAEIGNPRSLLYLEQWETSQDFEVQVRSQRFGTLLAIVETAPEAPALKVRTIPEQLGLEYIANIRLASSATVSPPQGCAVAAKPPANESAPQYQPTPTDNQSPGSFGRQYI